MPEKEGDDEKKSTKSVVNKKQKLMMGEEGYDIARDMGKVRPSKDKKDATTMPVSKEMRKTQKVNKGPSALELVKKKYGKAVMNVGKKKANEELDLTQVAEAFGGYIIEANGDDDKKTKKNTDSAFKKIASGLSSKKKSSKLNAKADAVDPRSKEAEADAESDMAQDAAATDIQKTGERFKRPVSGTPQAKDYKPKGKIKLGDTTIGGPVRIVAKKGEAKAQRELIKRVERQTPNVEKPLAKPASPAFIDPESDPFSDRLTRQYAADSGAPAFKQPPLPDPKTGPASKIDPQPTRKKRTARTYKASSPERRDARIAAVKAAIDKRNPTYTSPITGGKLPEKDPRDPSGAYQRRLEKAYFAKTPQGVIGGPSVLPPAPEPRRQEDIPKQQKDQKDQKDQRQDQQQQQQQQQNYRNFNQERQRRLDQTYDTYERIKQFYADQGKEVPERFKKKAKEGQLGGGGGRSGGSGGGKGGSGGGGLSNSGGPLDNRGGPLGRPKKPSLVSKSPLGMIGLFAKDNPALAGVSGLAAYDLGKGIFSKIMNLRGPAIRGGRAGFRSAGGNVAT